MAALLALPPQLPAKEPELPIDPEAMIEQVTDCMLALDGADHFFEDEKRRRQARLDEAELDQLAPAWREHNLARLNAMYAAAWDDGQAKRHLDAKRRDFWIRYFDRASGEYRPTRRQLLNLGRQASDCRSRALAAQRHAIRLREYREFTTCASVAGPLADRMAVEPAFGEALGVSAEEVDRMADEAFTALESVSNVLGHGNDKTRGMLQVRMDEFWNGPDPGDGTTLGDRVALVLRTCDRQLRLRRRASEAEAEGEGGP